MSSVLEIACLLGEGPEAGEAVALLSRLASLLADQPTTDAQSAADELDSVLFDLTPALLRCAALSPAAERQVRRILAAAAEHCTAREVFTLGMATLGEQLSNDSPATPTPLHGPASPGFQLFLLATLCRCLPRIRRRPLHFAAELLHMQLRWAAEVLPGLPLGDAQEAAAAAAATAAGAPVSCTAGAAEGSETEVAGQSPTTAGAVGSLARLAAQLAAWLQQQQGSEASQLSAVEQQAAASLLGMTLMQLAGLTLQLPSVLAAAEAAVAAAAQAQPGSTSSIGAAPAAGGRLPAMNAAAEQLLVLPQVLLRQVPAATLTSGSASSSSSERLQQLAATVHDQLVSSGLDPEDLSYFSSAEAEEAAAAAACAEALGPATPPQQQAAALQQVLPHAARLLLDLGAQHKSVALSLLPLGVLCTACGAVARSAVASSSGRGGDCRLAASTPALTALLSALVAIMSHNPVQLVRSCAHDVLQALLDAFGPAARLEQLRALMQMPSTAAAVVALQRLRQEMAAAWPVPPTQQQPAAASNTEASGSSKSNAGQLWLSDAALGLALPCLEHGTEAGWHDETSVLQQADVQAAALSLLRWVLLREAAAPLGLLPRPAAERLLQWDLRPLEACALRLLSAQSSAMAAGGGRGSEDGPSGSSSGMPASLVQQQQLDSYLAVQRLHEALSCVVELIEAPPGDGH